MSKREEVFKREKERAESFLGESIDHMPDIPEWVDGNLLSFWEEHLFFAHYMPGISLDEDLILPLWKEKPGKAFYRKIREGDLPKDAKELPGRWILIDVRDKPKKRVPWIRSDEAKVLEVFKVDVKKRLASWSKQSHEEDYLREELKKRGFGSRFCLDSKEARELRSFTLDFLRIKGKKIRFPFLAEYNYLGNVIYNQWGQEETWEWLEDRLSDGKHLAVGSKSVGLFGWEPPDFWSSVLSFRFVIEI